MRRSQLGIRSLIHFGFGALLALGLVLTIIAVWTLTRIGREVGRMDVLSENGARIADVSRDFEILRGTVQRNKILNDDSTANKAAQHAADQLRANARTALSDERRKIYVDLQVALQQFLDRRAALVSMSKRLKAEMAALFADGDEIVAEADKLMAAARSGGSEQETALAARVESDLMLVRIANWRFLATQEPNGEETFADNLAKARASLAALDAASLPAPVHNAIGPLSGVLNRYANNFALAAADSVKVNQLHDEEIVPQVAAMQTTIANAEASLREDFGAARAIADSTISATTETQTLFGLLALVLGGAFAFWIGRGIVRPITTMTRAMEQLAAGNTAVDVPTGEGGGEIAAMANAVQVFKKNAIVRRRLETDQTETQARAAAGRKADMLRLADEFEAAVGDIVGTVSSASGELESAATVLSKTAATTQELSSKVANASEETSSNIVSVATASHQLARSVDEIARQVQESSKIASEAVRQARETNARIAEQSKAATRISEVLELITALAEQTNLLALNATIEAARAGTAGKGFAVVAQEVKALAAQTTKAAEEIDTQISSVQATTEESVAAIKGIGTTIDRISEITTILAAAVEQQGAAARQIAHNVNHVAESTSEVTGNITAVNRGASQTGDASLQVLTSARSLAAESSRLSAKVDAFLATVRAA